jgi:hypothetical protein
MKKSDYEKKIKSLEKEVARLNGLVQDLAMRPPIQYVYLPAQPTVYPITVNPVWGNPFSPLTVGPLPSLPYEVGDFPETGIKISCGDNVTGGLTYSGISSRANLIS